MVDVCSKLVRVEFHKFLLCHCVLFVSMALVFAGLPVGLTNCRFVAGSVQAAAARGFVPLA